MCLFVVSGCFGFWLLLGWRLYFAVWFGFVYCLDLVVLGYSALCYAILLQGWFVHFVWFLYFRVDLVLWFLFGYLCVVWVGGFLFGGWRFDYLV